MSARRLLVIAATLLVAAVRADEAEDAREMVKNIRAMACDCQDKHPIDQADTKTLLTFGNCGDDRSNLKGFLQCLGDGSGLSGEEGKPSPDICGAIAEKIFSAERKGEGEKACRECIEQCPNNDAQGYTKIWNCMVAKHFPETNEAEGVENGRKITKECATQHSPVLGDMMCSKDGSAQAESTACFWGCVMLRSGGMTEERVNSLLETIPEEKREEAKKAIHECKESAPKDDDCACGKHYDKCLRDKGIAPSGGW